MSLSTIRRSTTLATKDEPLPECWAVATSASYARILAKKRSERTAANVRDARRIRRQERAIERGGL
jgi:hypothetical protein